MKCLALGREEGEARDSNPGQRLRAVALCPVALANSCSSFESPRERPLCSDAFPSASLLRSACVRCPAVRARGIVCALCWSCTALQSVPGVCPERRHAGIPGAGTGPGHCPPGPATLGNVTHPTGLLTLFLRELTLTNVWLVDEQRVCMRTLGTNFKRFRLPPAGIPAQGNQLTFNLGARMTNQDDTHRPVTCLIRVDWARPQVEHFSARSLVSLLRSLSLLTKLCLC